MQISRIVICSRESVSINAAAWARILSLLVCFIFRKSPPDIIAVLPNILEILTYILVFGNILHCLRMAAASVCLLRGPCGPCDRLGRKAGIPRERQRIICLDLKLTLYIIINLFGLDEEGDK